MFCVANARRSQTTKSAAGPAVNGDVGLDAIVVAVAESGYFSRPNEARRAWHGFAPVVDEYFHQNLL